MDSLQKKLLIYIPTASRSQDNFDNKSLILSCKNVLFITSQFRIKYSDYIKIYCQRDGGM